MKRIFKTPAFLLSILLLIFLCGCSENYKRYKNAKEKMAIGTEIDSHNLLNLLGMTQLEFHDKNMSTKLPSDYTYYEWAVGEFNELGDYKNSKEMAKEAGYLAATYFYDIYEEKSVVGYSKYYIKRAYDLFVSVGVYKDAQAKAVELSGIMLINALEFNQKRKPSESPVIIYKLFHSFDPLSKEKHAEIIYQIAAPHLTREDWGLDEEEIIDNFTIKKDKRDSFLDDLHNLNMVKAYKYVPDSIREKMYCAAISRVNSDKFWIEEMKYRADGKLQMAIFDYVGDYKDSKTLRRRIGNFKNIPYISREEYTAQADKMGINEQPRTIVIACSDDGKNSSSIKLEIEWLGRELKVETEGDIYISKDVTEACAVILYDKSHTFYRTFEYERGIMRDYYNTIIKIEIRSSDGSLLWQKTMKNSDTTPLSQIGADKYTMRENSFFGAPYYHSGIFETLNKLFTEKDKK